MTAATTLQLTTAEFFRMSNTMPAVFDAHEAAHQRVAAALMAGDQDALDVATAAYEKAEAELLVALDNVDRARCNMRAAKVAAASRA